jgi:uncharacterized protein (DUF111 family)
MIGKDIISIKPEYEDVRKISYERGVPLKDVMNRANKVFNEIYK